MNIRCKMPLTIFALCFVALACDASDDGANDSPTETTTDSDLQDSETSTDTTLDTASDSGMGTYIGLTPEEAAARIESGEHVVVIDVSPHYDDGHIPGSINLYVGGEDIDTALPLIEQSFTYIIYCHSDVASMLGAQKFVDAGFKNVFRLEGNYGGWVDAGFPVEITADGYMDISAATADVLRDGKPNVTTIDVSPYFDDGHLPGALNYPLADSSLADAVDAFDAGDIYLVYCHGDAPSISGAELLVDAGMSPVYRLAGNYGAWVDAGFPVE